MTGNENDGTSELTAAIIDAMPTATEHRMLIDALDADRRAGRMDGRGNAILRRLSATATIGEDREPSGDAVATMTDLVEAALCAHAMGRLGAGSLTVALLERFARRSADFQRIREAAMEAGSRLSTAFGGRAC